MNFPDIEISYWAYLLLCLFIGGFLAMLMRDRRRELDSQKRAKEVRDALYSLNLAQFQARQNQLRGASMPKLAKIYIAGPMSGYPDDNVRMFNSVAADLRRDGHEVANPVEINSGHKNATRNECMRRDIREMLTCDRVVMLPNWRLSQGAMLEHTVANALGIETVELGEFVPGIIAGAGS